MSKYFNMIVRSGIYLGGNAYSRSQIYAGATVSVRKRGKADWQFPIDTYILNSDKHTNQWIRAAHVRSCNNVIGGTIL